MAALNYSRDDYEKIKLNLPVIVDANEGMRKGKDGCVEIAMESGAPEYIKSAQALDSVITKINKAVNEAVEITEKIITKYKQLDASGMLS